MASDRLLNGATSTRIDRTSSFGSSTNAAFSNDAVIVTVVVAVAVFVLTAAVVAAVVWHSPAVQTCPAWQK